MSSLLTTLLPCLTPRKPSLSSEKASLYPAEKSLSPYSDTPPSTDEIASNILTLLLTSPTRSSALRSRITAEAQRLRTENDIHVTGWTNWLAEKVLHGLEGVLRSGAKIGDSMKEALEKATEAAEKEAGRAAGFAKEHPLYCTVLALGILVWLGMPWVLTALGFAEEGIVEGSFAARWMASYMGFVPKGSLFSYLQRLGMTLKWKLVV